MDANKYYVRFPITKMDDISVSDVVNLFHDWIREEDEDKVLLDVADYSHVPNGPGIILVGFYENIYFEINGKHPAFAVVYKRPIDGDNTSKVKHVFSKAVIFANKFQQAFEGKVTLDTENIKLGLNDRYYKREDVETHLKESISKLDDSLNLGWEALSQDGRDPKKLPEVDVIAKTERNLGELVAAIS